MPNPNQPAGLVVPDYLAAALEKDKHYQGMLTGDVAAESEVFMAPGNEKAFMTKLEVLMTEYRIHKLNIFWKGPFMYKEVGGGRNGKG